MYALPSAGGVAVIAGLCGTALGTAGRMADLDAVVVGAGPNGLTAAVTAPAARRAGAVHLGPTMAEIGAALRCAQQGTAPQPPFLITAQPSLFDDRHAPAGSHVFWVYAQVPNGWAGDLTPAVERQIERFAPSFRDFGAVPSLGER